jgi:hypothetical protein
MKKQKLNESQLPSLKEITEKLKGRILFPILVANAKEYLKKARFKK